MRRVIPPFPKYAFMAWCSVKARRQLYLYFYLKIILIIREMEVNFSELNDGMHFLNPVPYQKGFLLLRA
jgi:hypothetical protein